jgi:glutamine cyclotransferase
MDSWLRTLVSGSLVLALLAGCNTSPPVSGDGDAPRTWPAETGLWLVAEYPHEPVFTQGLVFADGFLFESTGLFGESALRKVCVETGSELARVDLPPELFAEGLTALGDRLYQLTWRSGQGRIYDRSSLELVGTFTYDTEGWGLTTDGRHLIMSDGSAFLRFLDATSLREVRRVLVRDGDTAVDRLNELEFIEGHVYANIWRDDVIVKIDPASGDVVARYDLSVPMAVARRNAPDIILNGIAYDPDSGHIFITGKRWSKLLELKLRPTVGREAPAAFAPACRRMQRLGPP